MIIRKTFRQLTAGLFILTFFVNWALHSQEIAILKYGGGGDWYANPTAIPNLIAFCNENINTRIAPKPVTVETGSEA
ncbi:MAG: DUF4159 domain-containing protein, partial [Bacteroidota bacterium]